MFLSSIVSAAAVKQLPAASPVKQSDRPGTLRRVTNVLTSCEADRKLTELLTAFSDAYGDRVDQWFTGFDIEPSWSRHGDIHPFEDRETWMLRHVEHRVMVRNALELNLPRDAALFVGYCVVGMVSIRRRAREFGNSIVFGDIPLPLWGMGVAAEAVERHSGITYQTLLSYDPASLCMILSFRHVIGIPGEPHDIEPIEKGGELQNYSSRGVSRLVPYRLSL